MAKGQKKTNREVRKPKAAAKPAASSVGAPASSLMTKGTLSPVNMPKKKG
jgi:hypothetical protein